MKSSWDTLSFAGTCWLGIQHSSWAFSIQETLRLGIQHSSLCGDNKSYPRHLWHPKDKGSEPKAHQL